MPHQPTLILPAPSRCAPTMADIAHDIARDTRPSPSPCAPPSDPAEAPAMTLARVRGGSGSRVAGVLPAQTVA